jgi:hypothetical protein
LEALFSPKERSMEQASLLTAGRVVNSKLAGRTSALTMGCVKGHILGFVQYADYNRRPK